MRCQTCGKPLEYLALLCLECGSYSWAPLIPWIIITLVFDGLAIAIGSIRDSPGWVGWIGEFLVMITIVFLLMILFQIVIAIYYWRTQKARKYKDIYRFKKSKQVDDLVKLLADSDREIREIVWHQLSLWLGEGEIHRNDLCIHDAALLEKSIALFNAELEIDSPSANHVAAEALGYIGDERAVTPLIKALRDKDYYASDDAIYSLGLIGARSRRAAIRKRVMNHLVTFLNCHSGTRRLPAAQGLGELADPRTIEPLLAVVRERATTHNQFERYYAAIALGKIGAPSFDSVKILFANQEADQRQAAVWALGEIIRHQDIPLAREAVRMLKLASDDPSEPVCRDAATILDLMKYAPVMQAEHAEKN